LPWRRGQAVFSLDASQSNAAFTLPDVLHTVHGSFKVKRGSIQFDPSTGAASGEIVVDATSGQSGSEARDKRMHKNILESQKFPEITFVPSRIHGTVSASGESKVEIDASEARVINCRRGRARDESPTARSRAEWIASCR
jgi:polyisoprenoid-binding protein YceI